MEVVNKVIKMNLDNFFGYVRCVYVRVGLENLEKVIWEEKDYEEAIVDMNKVLELNLGNVFYYSFIGDIYIWKEDYVKVIEYLIKVIEVELDFVKVYVMWGLVYVK